MNNYEGMNLNILPPGYDEYITKILIFLIEKQKPINWHTLEIEFPCFLKLDRCLYYSMGKSWIERESRGRGTSTPFKIRTEGILESERRRQSILRLEEFLLDQRKEKQSVLEEFYDPFREPIAEVVKAFKKVIRNQKK